MRPHLCLVAGAQAKKNGLVKVGDQVVVNQCPHGQDSGSVKVVQVSYALPPLPPDAVASRQVASEPSVAIQLPAAHRVEHPARIPLAPCRPLNANSAASSRTVSFSSCTPGRLK